MSGKHPPVSCLVVAFVHDDLWRQVLWRAAQGVCLAALLHTLDKAHICHLRAQGTEEKRRDVTKAMTERNPESMCSALHRQCDALCLVLWL